MWKKKPHPFEAALRRLAKAAEAIACKHDRYGYGAAHNILNDEKRKELYAAMVDAVNLMR